MVGLDLKVKLIFNVKGVERVGRRRRFYASFLESLAENACAAGFPAGAEEPASEDAEDMLPTADPLTVK